MHKRAKSESATMLTAHDGEDAELARMEGVLAKLLRKMHVSEDVNMTPRSQALVRAAIESRDPALMDEWDRMPVELRGEELIKSMEDRAKHGRDGRHEAIHADYTLRNVSSDMVRGGSAPAGAVGHPARPSMWTLIPEDASRRPCRIAWRQARAFRRVCRRATWTTLR